MVDMYGNRLRLHANTVNTRGGGLCLHAHTVNTRRDGLRLHADALRLKADGQQIRKIALQTRPMTKMSHAPRVLALAGSLAPTPRQPLLLRRVLAVTDLAPDDRVLIKRID